MKNLTRSVAMAVNTNDDRRIFPRKSTDGELQIHRLDHTTAARQNPFMRMQLVDLSYGGLCAQGQEPVAEGERLSICLPPRGQFNSWDAVGRVVRCDSAGEGYRVALAFDPLPMAA
jgi:PilZ domain